MFKDTATLKLELADYASPHSKLTRMVESGRWIRVRRGLYLDTEAPEVSPLSLAGILYGPSYVSFEYALAAYSLIPEKVQSITCASFRKNKHKVFDTPIGRFTYSCVPEKAYPYAVTLGGEGASGFLIATPEKALCDQLYKRGGVSSRRELTQILFEDLRMERSDILQLDRQVILTLVPLYRRTSLSIFAQWLAREAADA